MDMKMGFLVSLKKAWQGIHVDDDNDRRTRYVLTLWSFFLISVMIIACFVASVMVVDTQIALGFIDLIKHMMYVEGTVVSVYFGVESVFPSQPREGGWGGWGGHWGNGGVQKEVEVDPKKEPPAHPSESDSQVD